ncbi:SET domain-containing protein [uncultured Thiodictyon sp.]|uniref:SET domain-containing protein n=1 Tax=uncultured Thiodictyon sp. TaxID=1846217 RepID=UPI0025E1CFF3|nr:SET domain-containing protein [uncultured Thiodictyon sp.]
MTSKVCSPWLDARVRKGRSPIHGWGCFARIPFATGQRIGTFEGSEVVEDGPHVLWVYDPDGGAPSARQGTNLLRWLNHSAEPNAEFEVFHLYARRPIAAGEEITIDYGGAP